VGSVPHARGSYPLGVEPPGYRVVVVAGIVRHQATGPTTVRLICVDGPEKSGKTTLVSEMVRLGASYVHWGPVESDAEYATALRRHNIGQVGTGDVVVWDRGWASESVYSTLLGRGRRLGSDPWLGEWLYGRAFCKRVMLLGPDSETLVRLRTPDDLPVDPHTEREAFIRYGGQWGWERVFNDHRPGYARELAGRIMDEVRHMPVVPDAPAYCGSRDPRVVVVGEVRSTDPNPPEGSYLPWTSRYTTQLGRALGVRGLRAGWTNAHDEPTDVVRRAGVVVAAGNVAYDWCYEALVGRPVKLFRVAHPAWLYRWGKAKPQVEETEHFLRQVLTDALE
jgi:hypothetical protein